MIDKNSTYGTYFKGGKKLEPNEPYRLTNQVKFYLGGESNLFSVSL